MAVRTRDLVYAEALRKMALSERLNPRERREARRRRLEDGTYPLPGQPWKD